MSDFNQKLKGPGLVLANFTSAYTAIVQTPKGKPIRVAGPSSSTDRRLRCVLGDGEILAVETEGFWSWTVDEIRNKERNSGVPVELGMPEDRPLSLREELKRFIREEVSQVAQNRGAETLEEANDFDIDDEETDGLTAYEVMEMAPEAFIPEDTEGQPEADDLARERSPEGAAAEEREAAPLPPLESKEAAAS